jgi:hypothetical protein
VSRLGQQGALKAETWRVAAGFRSGLASMLQRLETSARKGRKGTNVPGHRRQQWRSLVAFDAAYLLVVQLFLVGLSMGVSAAASAFDPAGSFICSHAGTKPAPDDSGQQPGSSHLPNCCVRDCGMSGPSVLPLPAVVASPVVWTHARPIAVAIHDDRVDPRLQRTPRNPRAPPLTS